MERTLNAMHVRDWYLLYPHADAHSLSMLEEVAREEGVEATNPVDALKMIAWDTGYRGDRLVSWFKSLAKQLGVNVRKEHREGEKAGKENRLGSRGMEHLIELLARDYNKPSAETGYDREGVNPYLNTPPTELAEKIKTVKDPQKKKIQEALDAWRDTQGNPLAPGSTPSAMDDDLPGGLGDKTSPEDVDPKQLEMGKKVELEHTKDRDLAEEIAIDHLTEIDDYYTRLNDMEKGVHDMGMEPSLGYQGILGGHRPPLKDPENMDDDVIQEGIKRELDTYPGDTERAEEIAKWTLMEDPEYYSRMTEVDDRGYHPMLHVGMERISGILDAVKSKRMDWLWDYDPGRDVLFVKKKALDQIEDLFYDHMEEVGFPKPAYKWVLTMALVGGAASLQWKADSDVDVSVVIDWNHLFKEMTGWTERKWKNIGLGGQYKRIKKGGRLQGTLVVKAVRDALWGFGNFRGEGIIDKPALNKLAPGHPINYRTMRRLHQGDLRFDGQPLVIDGDSISAFIAELPTRRRREEDGVSDTDISWVQRVRDLPAGFNLKRDVPTVYDEALGLLRHGTMPFDYLWNPKKPEDIPRALGVLKTRYDRVKHDLRTKGFKKYQADPSAHSFDHNGETYALPDAFPANIAVKLIEVTGAEEAIVDLLFKHRQYRDKKWVAANFAQAKQEIRKLIYEPYKAVRKLLTDWSGTPRYKSPAPTRP